jgi:hypothetical protein
MAEEVLPDFPGKLLYSSLDTLRPGKLYLLIDIK